MIEVQNLSKNYGPFQALNDISFSVDKGQIVGFLGPNGAGKTTTMRVLTCFMPASSGKVTVAGYDVFKESREVRKRIGYLPENIPLYTEMTVTKYLSYMAKIRSVPRPQINERLDTAIESCGLTERRNQIIGQLSRGFRQRVGLAQALIHDPEVLILDEPTSGLDPRQIAEIRELIKALGKERTILFSTHILTEASQTCERLLIISKGKITGDVQLSNGRAVSSVTPIEEESDAPPKSLTLVVTGGQPDKIMDVLTHIPDTVSVEQSIIDTDETLTFHIQSASTSDIRAAVAKTIVEHEWNLLEMRTDEKSLEELFLSLTSETAE
ncbi:MFS transporter [Candidatus Poribacteria bacterium]|nr:MAG: MFS transporter [Candidatus Poribacteria bacterium]